HRIPNRTLLIDSNGRPPTAANQIKFHADNTPCVLLQLHDRRIVCGFPTGKVTISNVDDYIPVGETEAPVVYAAIAHFVEIGSQLAVLMRAVWAPCASETAQRLNNP